jgi:uncharacterized damage-inducible protein DinB
MHPRIKEVLDHLAANRRALRDAVDSVPLELRQTKPDGGAWSVADVLEHLALVETSIAGLLERKINEGRANGLGTETETSSVIESARDTAIQDRSYKIVSGEAMLPKSALSPEAAWSALERAGDALQKVVMEADGLALGEISAPHRAFGPLSGYQWLAFAGSHESRHAAQIREIGASLAGRPV